MVSDVVQSQRSRQHVVDTRRGAVQIGVGIDGADAMAAKGHDAPADGRFLRHGFERVKNDRMVGDDQLRAPLRRLPAHPLEGVERHENLGNGGLPAAAEKPHIVPVHFHVGWGKGFYVLENVSYSRHRSVPPELLCSACIFPRPRRTALPRSCEGRKGHSPGRPGAARCRCGAVPG